MRRLTPFSCISRRQLCSLAALGLLAPLCTALPGAAPLAEQGGSAQQSGPTHARPGVPGPFSDNGLDDPIFEERRIKALNEHRQKMVVSDTEKLLLATQHLQHEIEEQHADRLTPVELRELADIEKLARNIRANMADMPGGGTPMMNIPGLQR